MFLYRQTLPLSKFATKGKILPLAMEFPVDRSCTPVLVSGAKKANVWLHSHKGVVRAAIRSSENFEAEIIDAVTGMGLQAEWGNVHACNLEGYKACIEYLRFYDIVKISAVSSDEKKLLEIQENIEDENLETECQDWVPDGVIFIPQDRMYLGFVSDVASEKIIYVVQNPSRGLAIAR